MHLRLERYKAPLTELLLVTDENGALRALEFADHEERMHRLLRTHYGSYALQEGAAPRRIIKALDRYFAGRFTALHDVPVETGGSPFQRSVWQALRAIEPGTTASYGQIARQIGQPAASRAVGAANGSNPVAIVVPCHRVIGSSGTLVGYGGGLPRKRWLLEHEGCRLDAKAAQTRGAAELFVTSS